MKNPPQRIGPYGSDTQAYTVAGAAEQFEPCFHQEKYYARNEYAYHRLLLVLHHLLLVLEDLGHGLCAHLHDLTHQQG